MQDESEGALEVEKVAKRDDYIKDENGYATFVSPAGMPITIKPTGKVDIIASTEEYNYQVSDDENTYISTGLSIGILLAFEEEGKHYTAAFGADKEFLGYKDVEGDQYKYDNITKTYRESYFVNFIDAQEKFYLFESKFILSENWKDNEYKAAGSVTYPFDPDVFKTIVGDLSAEDYTKLVDELAERLNTQSSQSKYFSVGESFKTGRDEEFNIEDLNDRFKVFNTETGNKIFVDVVYTKDKPSSEQLSTLAEDAYKKSNLASSSNVIYMVLPVWNETVITNYLKSIDKSKFSKSYYSKNETYNNIPDLLEYKGTSGDIFEVVKSVYKLVPKPLIEYYHFVRVDGLDIEKEVIETEHKAGYEHIYRLHFWYDKQITDLLALEDEYEAAKNNFELNKYQAGYTGPHKDRLDNAKAALAEWYSTSLDEKVQNPEWVSGVENLKEAYIVNHILKESYIKGNHRKYVNNYIDVKFNGFILAGLVDDIESDAFFDPDYGEIVYAVIDVAGVALSPLNLDFIADGAGMFYAHYRGDNESIVIYGASLAAPVVSAILIKQLIKEGKVLLKYGDEIVEATSQGTKWLDDFLAASPKIDDLLPSQIPDGYEVFSRNGSNYIRRTDVSNVNTPRLMVDENGVIRTYTKPQRLSKNGKLRKALEDVLDEVPANHQAHHLVPDNIVRNSPLHQEAISRGLYDIDRASNGKLLAETGEDFAEISEAYPTHFGSHPNYDAEITEIIDDVLESHNVLPSQVKSLSDTKINQIVDDIEDQALGVLEEWIPSKLN